MTFRSSKKNVTTEKYQQQERRHFEVNLDDIIYRKYVTDFFSSKKYLLFRLKLTLMEFSEISKIEKENENEVKLFKLIVGLPARLYCTQYCFSCTETIMVSP